DLNSQEAELRAQLAGLDDGLVQIRQEVAGRSAAIDQPATAAVMAARLDALTSCGEATRSLLGIAAKVTAELNTLAALQMFEGDVGALTLDPRRYAQQVVAEVTSRPVPPPPF